MAKGDEIPKPFEPGPGFAVAAGLVVFAPLLLMMYALKREEKLHQAKVLANQSRPRGRIRV